MKQIFWAGLISALAMVGVGCSPVKPTQQTSMNNISQGQTVMDTYGSSAYLISEGPFESFDAKTKEALAGFTVDSKTQTDGTKTITLNATNPEYENQTYTLEPGQKLYFIEMSLGDDRDGQEYNLRDDHAIVTDSNGFIVEQK